MYPDPPNAGSSGLNRRTFMARAGGAALSAGSLAALLEACGSGATSGGGTTALAPPPTRPTGTLRAAIIGDPQSLDPALTGQGQDLAILNQIYEGLLVFDDRFEKLSAALATGYEQSDDGLEWTFHLRDNVVFHDGEAFDSAAVKATFDYILASATNFGALLLPAKFRKLDTSDPLTVRIALAEPYPDLARNQTFLRMISPRLLKQGAKQVAKSPVGTGPYRLGGYTAGQRVELTPFERHWGGRGPYLQQIDMPVVGDATARVSGLASGQIDVVNRVAPPQVKQLAANGALQAKTVDSWAAGYLEFICTNPAVRDPRVRQAVAWALDRQAIVEHILLGRAAVSDSVMPVGTYGHSTPATQYAQNVDKARALLEAAGNRSPKIRLAAAAGVHVLGEQIGDAIAGQLRDAGFQVDYHVLEVTVYSKDLTSPRPSHDVFFNEHFWLNGGPLILSLGIVEAYCKFADARYARLLADMKVTPDGPQRLKLLADLQDLIARQVPIMPMHTHELTDVMASKVNGYQPPKDGLLPRYWQTYVSSN